MSTPSAPLTLRGGAHHVSACVVETRSGLRVARRFAAQLTSVHRTSLTTPSADGDVSAVAVGVRVAEGDVLVARRTGDRDTSFRVPSGGGGVVVEIRSGPELTFLVERERRLAVGDVLALRGEPSRRRVEAIVDELDADADLAWPGASGSFEIEKLESAFEALRARWIGPYSLVTQEPTASGASVPERVDDGLLAALERRGAFFFANELVTIKSDDVPGRAAAFEAIVRGRRVAGAFMPESVAQFTAQLEALGLRVERVPAVGSLDALLGGELDAEPGLDTPHRIAFTTSELVRASSHGAITSTHSHDETTGTPLFGGLHCPRIFGPLRDGTCVCGAFRGVKPSETPCASCGVTPGKAFTRRRRFAHVELGVTVLHPLAEDVVAAWLAPRLGVDPSNVDAAVLALAELRRGARELEGTSGIEAVKRALRALDVAELAKDVRLAEPARRAAEGALASYLAPEDLLLDAWPVLPADLRPIVRLANGRWAVAAINDAYADLLEQVERHRRMVDAPAAKRLAAELAVQRAVDTIVRLDRPNEKGAQSPHAAVFGPHSALHRARRKTVDYAGRGAVVVADVAPREVRLPRSIARDLFRPWLYEQLEREGVIRTIREGRAKVEAGGPEVARALVTQTRTRKVLVVAASRLGTRDVPLAALEVTLWDEPAIGLAASTARSLGIDVDGVDELVVHVPLREESALDLEPLPDAVEAQFDEHPGWILGALEGDVDRVVQAAFAGEEDPLEGLRVRACMGVVGPRPRGR